MTWDYIFVQQRIGVSISDSYVTLHRPGAGKGDPIGQGAAAGHVLDALTRLGAEGWELTGIEHRPGSQNIGTQELRVYWLKRPSD